MARQKKAQLEEVPVIITNIDDLKSLEFAIVEMFKEMILIHLKKPKVIKD